MKKITFLFIFFQSVLFYSQTIEGTWKLSPQAGAFAVGPAQGDYSWYTSSVADVTNRACLFDDEYVFNPNGSFQNILGSQTWLEGWQGATPDACGTPVAPHNGSGSATYAYDNVAGTLTLNGQGAFMGLAKAINGSELTTTNNAPTSVTYIVSSLTTTQLVLVIHSGSGPNTPWWRFTFEKQTASPIEGTWKLSPQAGAFAVGPAQGDYSWYTSSVADVTNRACLFDDEYVFNPNGSFQNILGSQTWLEGWQGATPDACGTPVAPHNGSGSATYAYDNVAGTLTLNGQGAFMGLAKAINGSELTTTNNAPTSVTYIVSSLTTTQLVLVIHSGSGPNTPWWRFTFVKNGAPTCNDGIQNGTETGVDCGGSCQPCAAPPPTIAAPTPPARAATDVISLFSDAYTNIAIANWNQAPIWYPPTGKPVLDVLVASNPTKKIEFAGDGFIGVVFSSLTNATDMTHFHMDYWIPSGTDLVGKVLNPKLSNHALTNPVGESNALLLTNLPTTAGSWVSLDVPLSNFAAQSPVNTPSLNREALKEFLIQSNLGDVYIDNIYLHKNTVLSSESFTASKVKLYPNPTSNVLNIESLRTIQTISVYNVMGQEVINKELNSTSTALDVSSLNSGIYVVKTNIDGVISSMKFIKQ